jgi:BolA-like protein 1
MSTSEAGGPVEQKIFAKLASELNPSFLDIENESYKHNVPKGSESHFKVCVVSSTFEGMPLIKRHRTVNSILAEELKEEIHAMSILAKTPSQWEKTPELGSTPNCLGGSKA